MKRLKNKKGFSLVELVVAMLIMSIVTASLSTILFSTYSLYDRSEITTTLFNVSQKLHIALNSEFSACQDMNLYTDQKPSKARYDSYEVMIYRNNDGYIKKDTLDKKDAHVLLSEKSYRGATVKSFTITIQSIKEKLSYDDDGDAANRRRVLVITTVLVKGKVEYTHVSTVKLYNMQLWGTEIENGKGTHNYSETFQSAVFHYSQYFNIS